MLESLSWELVTSAGIPASVKAYQAEVPGGVLVMTIDGSRMALAFVPAVDESA